MQNGIRITVCTRIYKEDNEILKALAKQWDLRSREAVISKILKKYK